MEIAEAGQQLLPKVRGRTLLVARGQWPNDRGWRHVVLRVDGRCPETLWDGFSSDDEITALCGTLAEVATVWRGGTDMMAATPWALAWTRTPAPFRLWTPRSLRVSLDDGVVLLARWPRSHRIPLADVTRVTARLSSDWVLRTVVLETNDQRAMLVAGEREWAAIADPTYDGINLMCEASWARELATSMAEAFGVPATIPEEF